MQLCIYLHVLIYFNILTYIYIHVYPYLHGTKNTRAHHTDTGTHAHMPQIHTLVTSDHKCRHSIKSDWLNS